MAEPEVWKIGSWLSAALDDPNVCAEMKADIQEWFDQGGSVKSQPTYDLKVEVEPHRVCQNYKPARNQEMAGRIVSIIQPQWRGSVKSTAAKQVEVYLDRELTRMWNDIEEFHHKFHLSYGGAPRVLPEELMDFRIKFLQEELDEYKRAWGDIRMDGDSLEVRAEMLDALVDLVYVALGTAYLHGFNFAEAWRRVQVANMAKVRVERAEDSKRGSTFDVVKPNGWLAPSHIDLVGTLGAAPQDFPVATGVRPVDDLPSGGGRESYTDTFGGGLDVRDSDADGPAAEDSSASGQSAPDHDLF